MEIERKFNCDKCGLCCLCLKNNPIIQSLGGSEFVDETGACRYLDKNTMLCTIYEDRPIFCRVDDLYDNTDLKDEITRSDWYRLNHNFCNKIKQIFNK